jgi:hypothetical protein
MTIVTGLQALMQTYGSSIVVLVAWVGFLALAVVVFLVLLAIGAHQPGRGRPHRSADARAPLWPYGIPPAPHGPHHQQEPRPPYERR